ncbi:DNA internalization-related competence protein ComEC/Rec2 [Psychromonas algicola]|uniref:DNA internalization-related competence protein ComEC/Rec2 n=1 Tax=Psychromonas algicola TaxID=2555642 RepID=UPI001419B2C3|nr:DNA internalization-related competence protein ComEC/Rec2 [Psychromonas sp. RZ5]
MRITIWLSIAVFVSTLFWPHLLTFSGLLYCALSFCIFIYWPKWRYLAILPLTIIYFNSFTYTTLLGISNGVSESNHTLPISVLETPFLGVINKQRVSIFSNIVNEQDNNITIQIKSLINSKNNGYFIANIISINEISCFSCPLIEMRWFKPNLMVQAGQIHEFKVRLKPLQGKANPGGFDRQKWRYSEHVAYIANIKQHIKTVDTAISFRAYLYQKTLQVTADLKHQGALLALIFADKSLMTVEDKEAIKTLGIAHLFAISGLHIGLMFAFSFAVFNVLIKSFVPIPLLGWLTWRLTNICGLLVCLGYGYVSGFSLPTQRALLMLFFSLLVLSSKRKVSLFDLLGLCLWFILLIDPLAILSSSLWLSFTAITSILIFIWAVHRPSNINLELLPWWKVVCYRFFTFIKWLCLLQLLLTLLMLPIQMQQFSALSSFSLFINLFAIPYFSWLVIPTTLLGALLLNIVEPLGKYLLMGANELLNVFLDKMDVLSSGYILLSGSIMAFILSILLLIVLLSFIKLTNNYFEFNKKYMTAFILFFITFIGIRFVEKHLEKQNIWQVEVFDIGQGLAVLVKSAGETLLYDTGPSYPPYYAAATGEILPYLQMLGISKLDYLFVSHSDNDHAGGAYTILHSLYVNKAFSGEAFVMNKKRSVDKIKNERLFYEQCLAGQLFHLGKLTVEVLSPNKVGNNDNNNSCVVKISDGEHALLLTGDINKDVEADLIYNAIKNKELETLTADILVAPHHGSKTSSSNLFIKHVNPEWVVFSAGYRNRWNFPITEVVQRYQQQGVKQVTTSKSGFIRFNVQNQHINVKTYREDLAAYWYHRHSVF